MKIVRKVLIGSRRSMDCLSLLENIPVTDRKRAGRREERDFLRMIGWSRFEKVLISLIFSKFIEYESS